MTRRPKDGNPLITLPPASLTSAHGEALSYARPQYFQQAGAQIQQALSTLPDIRSIFAERVSQGFYVNIEVNRAEAARYGLTVADVQQAVSSGIGGQVVTENIEGRERIPSMSGTTAISGIMSKNCGEF